MDLVHVLANGPALEPILGLGVGCCILLLIVVIIVFVLAFFLSVLIDFLPATLLAIAVLLLTGSWLYAGVTFIVVAAIMVLSRSSRRK